MSETTSEVETVKPSTARKITASVTTTAVMVVLGVVANALISKVTTRVSNAILPEDKKTEITD